MQRDTVTVERFYTQQASPLQLKMLGGASGLKRVIHESTVNRPGLVLAGFTRYFAHKRVQILGNAEMSFIRSLRKSQRLECYRRLLMLTNHPVPCVVLCRNAHPDRMFLKMAEEAGIPVFSCPFVTMKFISLGTIALEAMFAPRGSEMGSMVDILGIGVIIRGESGIGKSESVLALLERGYSLVSDDVTRVTLLDGREVVGTSADLTRNHMEVRGIGLINVAAMFGIKSIRHEKRVDLVVTLKPWEQVPEVDRLGIDEQFVTILGVPVRHMIIPVRPGRDLARLVEVAALQARLQSYGYNAAKDFNERLLEKMNPVSKD